MTNEELNLLITESLEDIEIPKLSAYRAAQSAVAGVIHKAVEREREACAQIAKDAKKKVLPKDCCFITADEIMAKIRARGK